jgi:hypothetical protein
MVAKQQTTKRRPPPEGLPRVIFVRVNDDLIARLDAYAEVETKKLHGRIVTRSDAVRELLYTALALT